VSGGREGKVELQEKRLMIFAYSGNLNLFRLFTHTHTHTQGFGFPPLPLSSKGVGRIFSVFAAQFCK
jgi:hypothetical protein